MTNPLKVILELSQRSVPEDIHNGISPGGTVCCWRQTGELVQHLKAADKITLQPTEVYRVAKSHEYGQYTPRVDVTAIFWMSAPPL
jgi:hypothetical protein